MDKLTVALATVVPGILAIVVVAGWIAAVLTGIGDNADLRDVAFAVIAFYFGGVVHSNGMTAGAKLANGTAGQ